MEHSNSTSPGLLSKLVKGFVYTAASGALMSSILMGVLAGAGALSIGAGIGLAPAAISIGLTTLSVGLFGAVLQGFNYMRGEKEAKEIGQSQMNPRDVAITAVSANLPTLTSLREKTDLQQPEAGTDIIHSAHFQDKHPSQSLNARVNALLSREHGTQSHAERLKQQREEAAAAPAAHTLH